MCNHRIHIKCNHRIHIKLKGKFYKTTIRPVMLYGIECWAIKKKHIHKMSVVKVRMLRRISGNTRKIGFKTRKST